MKCRNLLQERVWMVCKLLELLLKPIESSYFHLRLLGINSKYKFCIFVIFFLSFSEIENSKSVIFLICQVLFQLKSVRLWVHEYFFIVLLHKNISLWDFKKFYFFIFKEC